MIQFDLRIIFLKWVGVYQPPCSNRSGAVSFWGQSCEGLSMMIATWQRPPSMMIHLTGKPVWCFRGVSNVESVVRKAIRKAWSAPFCRRKFAQIGMIWNGQIRHFCVKLGEINCSYLHRSLVDGWAKSVAVHEPHMTYCMYIKIYIYI